jgi:hypothetical protein
LSPPDICQHLRSFEDECDGAKAICARSAPAALSMAETRRHSDIHKG